MSPRFLDLGECEIKFEGSLEVRADLSRPESGILHAVLEVRGAQECECARCLEVFHRQRVQDMVFTIDLKNQISIDLVPWIREEIMAEQPIRVLCRDECRGLCAVCGVNLNKNPCRCAGGPTS